MSELPDVVTTESKVTDRWPWKKGWGISAITICCATNLLVASYVIPRGGELLHDFFEGAKIPALSRLALGSRWVFVALACIWPVAAIWIRRRPRATLYVAAILVITLGQALFAGIAILYPVSHMLRPMGGGQ